MKTKIIWQDVVLILGFLLYFGVGAMTNIMLSRVAGVQGFADAAVELESNPIMRKMMDWRYGMMVTQWLAISLLGSVYYGLRYIYHKNGDEKTYLLMGFYVIALCLLFAHNIMNDMSVVIGTM